MTVIDTTDIPAEQVGEYVADWCQRAVRGVVPTFSAGWHLTGC